MEITSAVHPLFTCSFCITSKSLPYQSLQDFTPDMNYILQKEFKIIILFSSVVDLPYLDYIGHG